MLQPVLPEGHLQSIIELGIQLTAKQQKNKNKNDIFGFTSQINISSGAIFPQILLQIRAYRNKAKILWFIYVKKIIFINFDSLL